MNLFAIGFVVIAGAMWAGSGLAAEHFLMHNPHTAMDLTVFRMLATAGVIAVGLAMRGSLKSDILLLYRNPKLWSGVFFYGLGIMIMQHAYFMGIRAGNAAAATVMQYICPALVICWLSFRNKRIPGKGDCLSVVLAITGVYLLVSGGNVNRLSVPAECVCYSLISATFFAFCAIYPKRLMVTLNNSFLLMFAMLLGGISGYIIDPVTDISAFFEKDVIFDLFMIIICGTVIAFICYNAGLAWLSESQASVTAAVEPAISVIASYFIFGTTFGIVEMGGIFLVISAIVIPAFFKEK